MGTNTDLSTTSFGRRRTGSSVTGVLVALLVACGTLLVGTGPAQASSSTAVPELRLTQPSCANGGTTAWRGVGTHVAYRLVGGTVAPGEIISVRATARAGYVLPGGGRSTVLHQAFLEYDASTCPAASGTVTPYVYFFAPDCSTPGQIGPDGVGWTGFEEQGVTYVAHGTVAPGGQITVTATPKPGFDFDGPQTVVFEHTYPQPACG